MEGKSVASELRAERLEEELKAQREPFVREQEKQRAAFAKELEAQREAFAKEQAAQRAVSQQQLAEADKRAAAAEKAAAEAEKERKVWQGEWERKFGVLRKLCEAKTSDEKQLAFNNSQIRSLTSSVSAPVLSAQPATATVEPEVKTSDEKQSASNTPQIRPLSSIASSLVQRQTPRKRHRAAIQEPDYESDAWRAEFDPTWVPNQCRIERVVQSVQEIFHAVLVAQVAANRQLLVFRQVHDALLMEITAISLQYVPVHKECGVHVVNGEIMILTQNSRLRRSALLLALCILCVQRLDVFAFC